MPGLNRKGPNGEGPMTGRKMGRCNPDNKGKTDEEIMQSNTAFLQTNQKMGQGLGRSRGFGRGLAIGRGMGMRFRRNG